MGRPLKRGLDYFPLDVEFDDDGIALIEAEFGLVSFAVVIKIWQKIYKHSYYIQWGDDEELLFSVRVNSGVNLVNSVVKAMLRRNLLDKDMYKVHGILTSAGIQRRYLLACKGSKRKNVLFNMDYSLLLDGYLNELYPELIGLTMEVSTQSKQEKSKQEETRGEESITKSGEPDKPEKKPSRPYKEIVEYLNLMTGKGYRHSSKATKDKIDARMNEKATLEDFKKVIKIKSEQWKGTSRDMYLRPGTLFGTKFDGYLNEVSEYNNKPDKEYDNQPMTRSEKSDDVLRKWVSDEN